MSLLIIGLVVLLFFVLIMVMVILLIIRLPSRSRGKVKYIGTDDKTGALQFFSVSKRKFIQTYGQGQEIYPFGLKTRPISISDGWRVVEFPNVNLVCGKEFLEKIDKKGREEVSKLEFDKSKLSSENSKMKTELMELRTKQTELVDTTIDKEIKRQKELAPVYKSRTTR